MKFQKWNIGAPDEQDIALLRGAGYPYLLSVVLAARGVHSPEAAAEALDRERSLTLSPMGMKDMDKAVARIQRAIADGETIAVFGDYDVDGITSTVLLMDYLKSCGVKCLRYIPRRVEDGYGLSCEAIRGLRDQGATLMVTVDCGITGNEEVAYAASLGMDVVVTDHHECKEQLPAAVAVVDPHRPDCPYPFKHLAGVGVALKLVLALGGQNREDALFARYCTLAAIGTVADVMRMEGENRTIVSCGLEALPHTDFVHSRPFEGGGPAGQAHHLHPDRLRPLTPDQRRGPDGRGGSGGGPAGNRRSRPGRGTGPAAVRSQPGTAGGGAGHLRRRRRQDHPLAQ